MSSTLQKPLSPSSTWGPSWLSKCPPTLNRWFFPPSYSELYKRPSTLSMKSELCPALWGPPWYGPAHMSLSPLMELPFPPRRGLLLVFLVFFVCFFRMLSLCLQCSFPQILATLPHPRAVPPPSWSCSLSYAARYTLSFLCTHLALFCSFLCGTYCHFSIGRLQLCIFGKQHLYLHCTIIDKVPVRITGIQQVFSEW